MSYSVPTHAYVEAQSNRYRCADSLIGDFKSSRRVDSNAKNYGFIAAFALPG